MDWQDGLMIVGLCLVAVAATLFVRQSVTVARLVKRQKLRRADAQRLRGAAQDWCGAALWFGMILVFIGQISHQMQRGAPVQVLLFSLVAGATGVFVCGTFVGRLTLRRQSRIEAAELPVDPAAQA